MFNGILGTPEILFYYFRCVNDIQETQQYFHYLTRSNLSDSTCQSQII
jgi:hypothetical protein